MKAKERSTMTSGTCSLIAKSLCRHKVAIALCLCITLFAIYETRLEVRWRRITVQRDIPGIGHTLMIEGRYCVNDEMCLSNDGNIYFLSKRDRQVVFKATIEDAIQNSMSILHRCPKKSPILLGRMDYYLPDNTPNMLDIEKSNPLVTDGGQYKPSICKAKWKVAIVIPFRNREVHLLHFLDHMHPLLQRQQIDYRIYVINQYGNSTFNRGKLNNIGFVEMMRDDDYDCVVFHDVDLLLENDHVSYGCSDLPMHLAVAVSIHNYTLSYEQYTDCTFVLMELPYVGGFNRIAASIARKLRNRKRLPKLWIECRLPSIMTNRLRQTYQSGVAQFTRKHFERVNGFSNLFWGWGGEDDDLFFRVYVAGLNFTRYPLEISRYYMFKHDRDKGNEVNEARYDQLHEGLNRSKHEGLNTLSYKVIDRQKNRLYYNITVDVLAPAESMIKSLSETKRRGASKELKEIRKNALIKEVEIN